MPLIYKPYQATLANKEGQKLYYPRLVKFGKMVNTQKMAELIAEKASLTAGDVHNVIDGDEPGGGGGEAPDPAA